MIFDRMQQTVAPIMKKIYKLPFNLELAHGTLAKEKFIFYLHQDAIYLSEFSKVLAITAAKLPDTQLRQKFLQFAQETIPVEQALHLNYLRQYAPTQACVEPTPTCFMYTQYLLKTASLATMEESVASLLPCFWVYHAVGKKIASESLACNERPHPYSDWISLYTDQKFANSVTLVIDTVNNLGAEVSDHIQNNMIKAFTRSIQLEWLFWHSAYHQEQWLV